MTQHQCHFDFTLLPKEHKLPPHDNCYVSSVADSPTIYTLHWYRRASCVIQHPMGPVVLVSTALHDPFKSYATLQDALPELQARLK